MRFHGLTTELYRPSWFDSAMNGKGQFMTARFQIGAEIPSGIPLQHGLEGELEVEIRRVPIAALLLEAIGRFRSG